MEVDESSLPEMTSAGPVLESMEESIPKEDSLEKTVRETLTELEEETAGQMGGATVSADVTSDDIQKTDAVPEVEVNAEAQILPDKESTSRVEISDLVTEELKPPSELDVEDMEGEAVSAESLAEKPVIPSIKPPISLPDLPDSVVIPDDPLGRTDLMVEIYETLFLAMSIGASKIMGVSPARGLTKQFLPFNECKKLLEGVDVKSNAVIDFEALRVNAEKIKVEDREAVFLKDFSRIISVITDNYGKVMGYDAFRGMVRSEFRAINDSYGDAMDELGIKGKMHPELQKLL